MSASIATSESAKSQLEEWMKPVEAPLRRVDPARPQGTTATGTAVRPGGAFVRAVYGLAHKETQMAKEDKALVSRRELLVGGAVVTGIGDDTFRGSWP